MVTSNLFHFMFCFSLLLWISHLQTNYFFLQADYCSNALNNGILSFVDDTMPLGTVCRWLFSIEDDDSYITLEIQHLDVSTMGCKFFIFWFFAKKSVFGHFSQKTTNNTSRWFSSAKVFEIIRIFNLLNAPIEKNVLPNSHIYTVFCSLRFRLFIAFSEIYWKVNKKDAFLKKQVTLHSLSNENTFFPFSL